MSSLCVVYECVSVFVRQGKNLSRFLTPVSANVFRKNQNDYMHIAAPFGPGFVFQSWRIQNSKILSHTNQIGTVPPSHSQSAICFGLLAVLYHSDPLTYVRSQTTIMVGDLCVCVGL